MKRDNTYLKDREKRGIVMNQEGYDALNLYLVIRRLSAKGSSETSRELDMFWITRLGHKHNNQGIT